MKSYHLVSYNRTLPPYPFKDKEPEGQKQRGPHAAHDVQRLVAGTHAYVTHRHNQRPENHHHRREIQVHDPGIMTHFPHLAFVDDPLFAGFLQHVINRLRHAAGLLDDMGNIQIRRFDQHAFRGNVLLDDLPHHVRRQRLDLQFPSFSTTAS